MDFKLIKRGPFSVCGYSVETCLKTCGPDLHKLWNDFEVKKKELFDIYGKRENFYGLMWKTAKESDHYYYLIGIEINKAAKIPEGAELKQIPSEEYAVASVPPSVSAVDAWTDYYYKTLPKAGYEPNAGSGIDFEYYPLGGNKRYEIWTPVVKKV